MASPSSYTIVTMMTAAQQKAAAAAAARRKRRKVLRSQSPHRFQKRFKTSPPAPPQGGAKRPLTSSTCLLSTPTPKTTTSTTTTGSLSLSRHSTNTATTTSMMFQPTVQGIHQVASELSAGQVLALPTECTYEAVTQLSWNEPNDWADRIQPLYQVMTTTTSSSTTTTSTNSLTQEDDHDDDDTMLSCDGLLTKASNNQNTDSNVNQGRSSSSSSSSNNGNSCSSCVNNHQNNSSNSGATTCAHTRSCHGITNTAAALPPPPHIYLHMAALDVHPFWRKCLPKRPYAVRNREGEVLAAHAFNETAAVLRLLAAKMWPGPVVMHVAVVPNNSSSNNNNNNYSADALAGLTVQRHGKKYLALRSLCHPLTVKVYQEYLKKTSLMTVTSTTATTTTNAAASRRRSDSVPEEQQRQSPPPPPLPQGVLASDSSPISSNGSGSGDGGGSRGCDSPLTPNSSKARRLSLQQSPYLLVGTALEQQQQHQQQRYVTMATQVPPGTMVLHGEERREIFAVPTCEYGCPSPISLWLDAAERCVVVVRRRRRRQSRRSCQKDGDGSESENDDGDSNNNSSSNSSNSNNNHVEWTAQQLLQTLRTSLLGLGKTGQDRVIQAVLSRWQVKEEEEEEEETA